MELNEFVKQIADAIEVEDVNNFSEETEFHDLDEWSSLSALSVVTFINEEFGKELKPLDIRQCDTVLDLYKMAIQ